MKTRKIILTVAIMIVMIITISISQSVFAATSTTPKYIRRSELRTNDTPNFGYSIGEPGFNGAAIIWNLVEYTGEGEDASIKATGSKNIYCVKAGQGFVDSGGHPVRNATYNTYFDDMKTKKDEIKAQNEVLRSIVEGTVPYGQGTVSKYSALLALGDMLYFAEDTAEDKESYLTSAGIDIDEYEAILTTDDIEAVQQAAIWYFTNYGEENNKYDKTSSTGWLWYTTDGENFNNMSGYNPTSVIPSEGHGAQRQEQAEILYNYLINTAKANANNYSSSTSTVAAPAELITTKLNYTTSGNKYIVGPIRINNVEGNNTPYNIDFSVNKDFKFYINGHEVQEGATAKNFVGQDFYISVDSIENLEVSVDIKYTSNKLVLWASSTNNQEQPLMIPEKHVNSDPKTLRIDAKPFDLALRKYITKVNGVNVRNTRVPNIEESTLTSGTTATYRHRKDPVSVETGDIVTYNITIYNEGEKEGRATKIVDQLPTGLKFKQIVSGNFVLDSYSETGDNKLSLKRKSNNEDNLPAYSEGHLSSETIEIECEVTETPDTTNRKVLTNISWISEEFDAETETVITNQSGLDRDSEPSTHPDYNKDNMSNYNGSGNKDNLEDSSYYYKGEQDDDDFEKLVLNPQVFDLKLIKNITEVNGNSVTERLQSIDVSRLNTANSSETTATYNMDKNPISVAKGDIVTYRLRVYNEGTLDGYASEITEDIPEGLEFIWSEKEGAELQADTTLTDAEKEAIAFNQQYLWGNFQYNDSRDKIIQISSDYLSKSKETSTRNNLIKAFGKNDGTKTEQDLKNEAKEIFVKMKVISDDVTGSEIRNEACISEDSDKDGNEIEDRDSNPKQWVKYEDDEDFDRIVLKPFDLALRKFIIAVSDDETIEESEYLKANGKYTREPIVDTSKLNTVGIGESLITTATYNHTKEPVEVQKGDIVVYMLRVYNEGDVDGYAAEIKDHLPLNLEFVNGAYNRQYGWSISEDGRTATTRYLENEKINAAEYLQATIGGNNHYSLDYNEVPIMCRVKDTAVFGEKITNIADITEYLDKNKQSAIDRDSQEDNVNAVEGNKPEYKDNETGSYIPGQQDDDDFEKVIIPQFDLALRKFIIAVSDNETIESSEYLKENGKYTRAPEVDTSELNTVGTNGKLITTATYNHTKEPVEVKKGDIVVYMLRVYNEGDADGYAAEIKDHLPSNLEFVDGEFNSQRGWTISEDGRTVTTKYLENELIRAAEWIPQMLQGEDNNDRYTLSYKEVEIMCRVKDTAKVGEKITNIADITKYLDKNKRAIADRDSIENNVDAVEGNKSEYKDNETGKYIPGQEDDDDFEKVIIPRFDLALRKQITSIYNVNTKKETKYNDRYAKLDSSKENTIYDYYDVESNIPTVVENDVVTYSIRIYNEGSVDGTATWVTDRLPSGLEYLPDDETNKEYGWKAYKLSTASAENAVKIGEKYYEEVDSKSKDAYMYATDYLKDETIKAYTGAGDASYKEVFMTTRVKAKLEVAEGTEYKLRNIAEIGDDNNDDSDSIPGDESEWKDQDDVDIEDLKLVEFDLALRKWVTQAIVIENNGQTVTETGHQPYDDPEQIVKVELHRKKLNEVTVKFRYSIRIVNEGDIAGYAKEITDYVPQGLVFVSEDNPGWTDEGNNVISTRLLENKLLQPGEFADVEVLLTWVNSQDNMGVMVNTAEISEDYNEYGVPDRDSTPDNKKWGEDDIDDAPVMLSISTGKAITYIGLGFIVLITIAGGVVLIKKYVL